MELTEAIRERRSAAWLTGPAPTDEEVRQLVTDAATGPDHGRLRPWRLVLVRDGARDALGAALAAGMPTESDAARARAATKPLRAPLLLTIVFAPQDNPKVPEWEQLAATAAMVHNLSLLLHVRGWGAMWRTGAPSRCPHVRALLGLWPGEQLLGWLYVGTPDPAKLPPPRLQLDPSDRMFTLSAEGLVTPMLSSVASGSHR
jgi:nitroreductase